MIRNIAFIIIYFAAIWPSINMEGFYEGQFGKSYQSDAFKWNMWDPNYYLETRLYGNPVYNSDFYIKFYSDKNYYQSERPLAVLAESHIGFKQDQNGRGFSATLFKRESRYYWLDGSMLGMINTGSVNNDGNGQGVRLDLWHSYNGSMSYIFSDFSQGSGDDIHLFRYRQSIFKNKVHSGLSIQKKNYASASTNDFNQVIAHDLKVYVGRYYVATEFAISDVPGDSVITSLNNEYKDNDFLKSSVAFKTEVRGLRAGSPQSGYWYINPGIFSYGDTYRNYMGDNQSNIHGYWINSYYLIPRRAITLTLNYSNSRKIVPDTLIVFNGSSQMEEVFDPTTNIYMDAYIEFVNGFKGKVAFSKKDDEWQGNLYKHYDFFTEISVENTLAKLKAQYKIKDIGETWEKHITGIELSINLNDRWRFFTRGMIVDDRVGSRHSIFTELQYRIGGSSEFYLQYGPNYWGQYGLVHDDGFVSSGTMVKELKFIIKGWF